MKIRPEKYLGLYEIWTHDLRVSSALLMFGTGQITMTCICLFPLSTQVTQVYDFERRDDSSCNSEVYRYTRARQERGTSYNFEVRPDRFQKTTILLRLHQLLYFSRKED